MKFRFDVEKNAVSRLHRIILPFLRKEKDVVFRTMTSTKKVSDVSRHRSHRYGSIIAWSTDRGTDCTTEYEVHSRYGNWNGKGMSRLQSCKSSFLFALCS